MMEHSIDKMVYICHEYGNDYENADRVADLVRALSVVYPDTCFVSPIHTFGFMYADLSYAHGMKLCLALLDMCDEMWVFGERSNSKGCLAEKEYCKRYDIPVREREGDI